MWRHRHWTITPTGSWVCVGCGADIRARPLAGEWICEQHPDKPWPRGDCPGPGMPARRSRGTASSDRPLSPWADALASLSGSVPRPSARLPASSGGRMTTRPTRHPPLLPGRRPTLHGFRYRGADRGGLDLNPALGDSVPRPSQTNATGPGGRQRPEPELLPRLASAAVPSSRDEADVLLVAGSTCV